MSERVLPNLVSMILGECHSAMPEVVENTGKAFLDVWLPQIPAARAAQLQDRRGQVSI